MATQAFPVKLAGAGLPFGKGSSLPAEPGNIQDSVHLFVRQAVVFADADVGVQLAFRTLHGSQSRNGGKLSGFPVKIVAPKDVAEEVGFQELVNGRGKLEKLALDRSAAEFCLVLRAEVDTPASRRGSGFPHPPCR